MTDETIDPVDEIRAIRHQISAQFDHDPKRLGAYYMELQEQNRDRLVDLSQLPPRCEEVFTPPED